jgi:hypothetical protein
MALNFPAQPYENQQVSADGNVWIWDGVAWNLLPDTSNPQGYQTATDVTDALVGYATEQYVQNELDALVGPVIPTKVSDLTNDSGYITSSALSGYATTSAVSSAYALKGQQFYLGTTAIAINRSSGVITLNNVSIDGSSASASTVPASGITGTTLPSSVVNSSLTSVGTLTNLTVTGDVTVNSGITATGDITANSNVVIPTAPTATTHAANKQYVDTRAIAFAVGMS